MTKVGKIAGSCPRGLRARAVPNNRAHVKDITTHRQAGRMCESEQLLASDIQMVRGAISTITEEDVLVFQGLP